jgi:ribonucleoside-diphosphate reductase alpha chain
LLELAREKGIPEKWVEDSIQKMANDNNTTKIAKAIGLNLRHGVHVKNVVARLNLIDTTVSTFLFQIRKFLSQYVKDGEKVEGAKCENCGSHKIVYSEGCFKCNDCGSSKCG